MGRIVKFGCILVVELNRAFPFLTDGKSRRLEMPAITIWIVCLSFLGAKPALAVAFGFLRFELRAIRA
jgi:hypothetical protein